MRSVDRAIEWVSGLSHGTRTASRRELAPEVRPEVAVGLHRAAILGCTLGGIFLDQTVSGIGTATLAAQQGDFALGPAEGAWIPTVFNAAYYSAIVASIWGLTRFGRRAFLIASLTGFALTSLACCGVPAWLFLIVHALQGLCLGGVFTSAATIIFVSHDPRELGRAFFGFSIASLSGSTAGPLIGGAFVEYGCWQDAYGWLALTSGVAACIGYVALPADRTARRVPFDTTAFTLVLLAAAAFQYVVNDGDRRDWFSDETIDAAVAALAIALLAAGIWTVRYSRSPLFTPGIFAHRNLVVGAIFLTVLAVVQSSNNHLVAYAQASPSFSPTLAGMLLAIRIPLFSLFIPIVGLNVLAGRLKLPDALTFGFLALGLSTWLLAERMTATVDFEALAASTLFIAIAQSAINQPLPPLIFGAIPRADAPMAAVVFKLTPLIAGAVASAFAQRVLTVGTAQYRSDIAGVLAGPAPAVARFAQSISAAQLERLAETQITTLAYVHLVQVLALSIVMALPAIAFIQRQPAKKPSS